MLLIVSMSVLVYVLAMAVVGYHLGGYNAFSHTHRAVIVRLLEHGMLGVCGGLLMFVGLGWRIGFEHYALGF